MKCSAIAARILAASACFFGASAAWADALPVRGTFDSRIRTAPYSSEQVYRLYGYVGYHIHLLFEPGESFIGVGVGDSEGIILDAQDNHLFLKPKVAKVGTYLTVLTSKRHYHFDYSATSRRPDVGADEVIYSLRFEYPPPIANAAGVEAKRTEHALDAAPAARSRNVDYWFCGHRAIKPVSASDDGVHTRLRFAAKAEQPAVFVRNEDGTESLLNFSMEGADVVIHRTARQLIVRRGKLTGCIVNKAFGGAGDRLDSSTISPEVERVTKEAHP